jgi:hypothetical protein
MFPSAQLVPWSSHSTFLTLNFVADVEQATCHEEERAGQVLRRRRKPQEEAPREAERRQEADEASRQCGHPTRSLPLLAQNRQIVVEIICTFNISLIIQFSPPLYTSHDHGCKMATEFSHSGTLVCVFLSLTLVSFLLSPLLRRISSFLPTCFESRHCSAAERHQIRRQLDEISGVDCLLTRVLLLHTLVFLVDGVSEDGVLEYPCRHDVVPQPERQAQKGAAQETPRGSAFTAIANC